VSSTIHNGCAPWSQVTGVGDSAFAVVTVIYSKTCHAAYTEMVLAAPPTTEVHTMMSLYQPQYGGPERDAGEVPVSNVTSDSTLISWDNSIKVCHLYNAFGPTLTDPDPVPPSTNT
jgi:hypothetical protein